MKNSFPKIMCMFVLQSMPGVHSVITADTLQGTNSYGVEGDIQVMLAKDQVGYAGQPVAFVLAGEWNLQSTHNVIPKKISMKMCTVITV